MSLSHDQLLYFLIINKFFLLVFCIDLYTSNFFITNPVGIYDKKFLVKINKKN